jgi:UDP-perosamine 4-acetyltransferase
MNPVVLIGGGGHAKVLIEALRLSEVEIAGITDPRQDACPAAETGVRIIGDDDTIENYSPDDFTLAVGLGGVRANGQRRILFDRYRERGYRFLTIIHPSAIIASDCQIDDGAQIMAGAVIQPGCRIGANTIVNTRASVDHDCTIGDHVHLAPGVTLSGSVRIAANTHVGIGTCVIQNIEIGESVTIGAGSVVIHDLPADATVAGAPARTIGGQPVD